MHVARAGQGAQRGRGLQRVQQQREHAAGGGARRRPPLPLLLGGAVYGRCYFVFFFCCSCCYISCRRCCCCCCWQRRSRPPLGRVVAGDAGRLDHAGQVLVLVRHHQHRPAGGSGIGCGGLGTSCGPHRGTLALQALQQLARIQEAAAEGAGGRGGGGGVAGCCLGLGSITRCPWLHCTPHQLPLPPALQCPHYSPPAPATLPLSRGRVGDRGAIGHDFAAPHPALGRRKRWVALRHVLLQCIHHSKAGARRNSHFLANRIALQGPTAASGRCCCGGSGGAHRRRRHCCSAWGMLHCSTPTLLAHVHALLCLAVGQREAS